MASINDVVRAAELLRQAAGFSAGLYKDVFGSLKTHHPELVPETMPERTDRDIAIATDLLIRKRFPTPPAFPAIQVEPPK